MGRQLGGGGFAVVYEGRYRQRPVAVKLIVDPSATEEQRREFMDELEVMARLRHPGIVGLVGACPRPPKQCFVMELCAGGSLFQLLHGGGGPSGKPAPLPLPHAVAIARDVAAALTYLHSLRPAVVHRDIKSMNVLLAAPYDGVGPPTVRLTDFGLVACANGTAGTPNYMAPELLAGRPFGKPVSVSRASATSTPACFPAVLAPSLSPTQKHTYARAPRFQVDVYAFGVLLWEICARCVPFVGWRPADIRDQVVGAGARPDLRSLPYDFPDDLRSVMTTCWSAEPARRPDIAVVHRQLSDWRPPVSALAAMGTDSRGAAGARPGNSGGDALEGLLSGAGARRPGTTGGAGGAGGRGR
jgi:serine/threonine protein kinase